VVEAHNRFGMLLLEQLLSDGDADDRNVVISPVSIALALSMAYNGAGGQTAEAMADATQLSPLLRTASPAPTSTGPIWPCCKPFRVRAKSPVTGEPETATPATVAPGLPPQWKKTDPRCG